MGAPRVMSRLDDLRVLNLDDFDEMYHEYYDPRRNMTRLRLLAGYPSASIEDAVDMIELLLDKHQNHFILHNDNPWVVQFPNMLNEPEVGMEVYNEDQDVFYTVEHVQRDPGTRSWNRWLRLTGPTNTAPLRTDNLIWSQKKKLFVRFVLAFPVSDAKPPEATEGVIGSRHYGPWMPTITARITKREPWGLDYPFSDRKQLKPMMFEVFRDARDRTRYSIEIWRQAYDNLVTFDCWAQDPLEAARLVVWFEDFIMQYVGVLKFNGVSEILEWGRKDIQADERWRDDLVGQRTTFYFRTERLRAVRKRNLTNLVFRMRVAKHPAGYVPGGNPATGDQLAYWRVHGDTGNYLYGTFEVEDHAWATPTHLPADGSFSRSAGISYNPGIKEYE